MTWARSLRPERVRTTIWSVNPADNAVPEAQDMMWQLALHMEEGQTEQSCSRRWRKPVRRRAMQWTRRSKQPNDANAAGTGEQAGGTAPGHRAAYAGDDGRSAAQQQRHAFRSQGDAALGSRHAADGGAARNRRRRKAAWPTLSSRWRELERMLDQLRNARSAGQRGQQAGQQQASARQTSAERRAGHDRARRRV